MLDGTANYAEDRIYCGIVIFIVGKEVLKRDVSYKAVWRMEEGF